MVMPDFSPMDEFCVAMERLLRRIVDECFEEVSDYEPCACWFADWLHSLGMRVSGYLVREDDEGEEAKLARWKVKLYHEQLHEGSHFYLPEITGREFARRLLRQSDNLLGAMPGASSERDLRSLAISIHCFLNASQDEETMERFAEYMEDR